MDSNVAPVIGSELVQIVDAAVADAYRRGGPHMVCRPGCSQCCHGVFAISQQDASRLREGLEQLAAADPGRASRLRLRVADSVARLTPDFPGNAASGILDEDAESSNAFDDYADDEPCPVLDPATGTCELYSHRPILCRTFGPPSRTEEGHLATCELCFALASTEEIAAAELDPSLAMTERTSNRDFNARHNLRGETLVAYALHSFQHGPDTDHPTEQTRPAARRDR